jgi:hypothetical protein
MAKAMRVETLFLLTNFSSRDNFTEKDNNERRAMSSKMETHETEDPVAVFLPGFDHLVFLLLSYLQI